MNHFWRNELDRLLLVILSFTALHLYRLEYLPAISTQPMD